MSEARRRSKRPEHVQTQLVLQAMRQCAAGGTHGLSLREVARAAGVTKGGLLHHFPSKAALLEAMFDGLLLSYDESLAAWMEQDNMQHARFTRAYVRLLFEQLRAGATEAHSALLFAQASSEALRARWHSWLSQQREHDGAQRDQPRLQLARAACDGLWLHAAAYAALPAEQLAQLERQLIAQIDAH